MQNDHSRPLLEVRGASIDYKADRKVTRAVDKVSFDVRAGECLALIGRSGCGKSTLLKAIGGFLSPSEGEILLGGQRIAKPGPDRMVVWQDVDQLLPWKTVEQNVAYPLLQLGMGKSQALEKALEWIEVVGLTRAIGQFPHQLSGGMKQRVAIARGFAANPAMLLMDEPFSALDALTRRKLQDELIELQARSHTTVVFVSHDIDEAAKIGSRVLVLSPHPGRVKATLERGCADMAERLKELIFDDTHPSDLEAEHE
jgi:NitT/TauT family transport system ATP-binding protein